MFKIMKKDKLILSIGIIFKTINTNNNGRFI